MPGRENSESQGVAMTSDSGRGVRPELGGEIETRDPRAVILAFYPRATSSPARKELREIADRNRRYSNALCVPPPARRALAAR